LPLVENEKVVKLLCLREMSGKFIVMVTKEGVIKKTDATEFEKIRSTGIRAIGLNEGDELAFCNVSCGKDTIVIATKNGMGIRFKEEEVRSMGRQAAGVRGINLKDKDSVVGLEVLSGDQDLLFATSRGYGKRVAINDFRIAHRGGMGVRTIPTGGRNGHVIGLVQVSENASVLLIDANGKIIRLSPTEIRTMGRQAKGVRLIRLDSDQELVAISAFEEEAKPKIAGSDDDGHSKQEGPKERKVRADSDFEEGEFMEAPSNIEAEPEEILQASSAESSSEGIYEDEDAYYNKNSSLFSEEE
jgi:DNA gyrase subunit A